MPTTALYNAIERSTWKELQGNTSSWVSKKWNRFRRHGKLKAAAAVAGRLPGTKFLLNQLAAFINDKINKNTLLAQKEINPDAARKASEGLNGIIDAIDYDFSQIKRASSHLKEKINQEKGQVCEIPIQWLLGAYGIYRNYQILDNTLQVMEDFLLDINHYVATEVAEIERSYNQIKVSCDAGGFSHINCDSKTCFGSEKGGEQTIKTSALKSLQKGGDLPDWAIPIRQTLINKSNIENYNNKFIHSHINSWSWIPLGVNDWKKFSNIGRGHKRTGVTEKVDNAVAMFWKQTHHTLGHGMDIYFLEENRIRAKKLYGMTYEDYSEEVITKNLKQAKDFLELRLKATQNILNATGDWLREKGESQTSKRRKFIVRLQKMAKIDMDALKKSKIELASLISSPAKIKSYARDFTSSPRATATSTTPSG